MNLPAQIETSANPTVPPAPRQWAGVRPSGLLAAVADRRPERRAFCDQPNREIWSGRPRIAWTYANTVRVVERLATFLRSMQLRPGAPIGICLPNGSEACVALLAVERAGFTPCLLSIGWSESLLRNAIEAAQVVAVVSQGRLADERPAEAFCRIAAGYFGLRFICAFGPDVPDGVIDLDRAILDTEPSAMPRDAHAHQGLVTFEVREPVPEAVFRPFESLLAATVGFLVAETICAGDRIVSLLPPDDHGSLATGLMASLVAGATLDMVGLPDTAAIEATVSGPGPVRLVAPGWLEPLLADSGLPDNVASVTLLQPAPVRFKARGDLSGPVTDVLCLGEQAILARARKESGHLAFSLDQGAIADGDLLLVRREEDGGLFLSGPAAETHPFLWGAPQIAAEPQIWRASGFKADIFAGIVIGVR
jgi:hypothetical protein